MSLPHAKRLRSERVAEEQLKRHAADASNETGDGKAAATAEDDDEAPPGLGIGLGVVAAASDVGEHRALVPMGGLPFKSAAYVRKRERRANRFKSLKQVLSHERFELLPVDLPTYANVEAPPSMLPPKKYCDLTGFVCKYTEPKTELRYCHADQHAAILCLHEDRVQAYLSLRKALKKVK